MSILEGIRVVELGQVLAGPFAAAILADLGTHGRVRDVLTEIRAVTMQTTEGELPRIRWHMASTSSRLTELSAPPPTLNTWPRMRSMWASASRKASTRSSTCRMSRTCFPSP